MAEPNTKPTMAPRMWGPSIVGFGTYHYTYVSGRAGDPSSSGA